ncbi:uncharacterized protein BJX67DRAFT_349631 [Aspergillus lucknowensis]|uniref:Uncharacterized protein n=1 Tax=Aspergillus lucknowensis TaxID=176173 RepID=A0ABR4LWE1_9EURO
METKTTTLKADLTFRETCKSLLTTDFSHMYLLHGIMSGAAEANLSLGLALNVDSMRNFPDILREKHEHQLKTGSGYRRPIRVVYCATAYEHCPPGTALWRSVQFLCWDCARAAER